MSALNGPWLALKLIVADMPSKKLKAAPTVASLECYSSSLGTLGAIILVKLIATQKPL